MSRKLRRYDQEYKVQAVKLVQETGSCEKVAEELDIPAGTLHGWLRAYEKGFLEEAELSAGCKKKMTANQENIRLRMEVELLRKEVRRLEKERDFLAEASAFFAVSRRKSGKD